jgi:hypothetical protein
VIVIGRRRFVFVIVIGRRRFVIGRRRSVVVIGRCLFVTRPLPFRDPHGFSKTRIPAKLAVDLYVG